MPPSGHGALSDCVSFLVALEYAQSLAFLEDLIFLRNMLCRLLADDSCIQWGIV